MKAFVKDVLKEFLDLLYPDGINCFLCGGKLRGDHKYGICQSCIQNITFIGDRGCKGCGKHLEGGGLCSDCQRFVHSFDRAYSLCVYQGIIKDSIFLFKYGGRSYLARPFGSMMAERIKWIGLDTGFELIVPVPLHPAKLRKRGYNQSLLLAKAIAAELKDKAVLDILKRERDTPALSGLKRHERTKALEGAFNLKNRGALALKNILLIDDIYTTGTTADECARVLKDEGAGRVYVFTLSSGKDV